MHPQDRLFCEIAVQLELLTRDQVAECQRTQQIEGKGRNIAAVTTALGFLSQAETELVLQHQQRVLERRREARAASQGQRDSESRAAVSRPAPANSAMTPTAPRRPFVQDPRRNRHKDPTPTSQWTHADAEPVLAPANAPVDRSGASTAPIETSAAPAAGRSLPAASGASRSAPASSESRVGPQARDTLDARPNAARRAMSTQLEARPGSAPSPKQPRASRGPGGTQLGPPPVNASVAAASRARSPAPPPPRVSGTPAAAHANPAIETRAAIGGGTLLGASGMAARQVEAANKPRARPVPQGRDWRNPSQPPPMAANERDVQLNRVAHADTLALPANDAQPARVVLPAPETPRFLDAALSAAVESGASDLHIHSGAPPHVRIDGKLWPMSGDAILSRETAERVIAELLDEGQWMQLMVDGDLRFAYELADVGRFRAHAYCQERGTDIVLRALPKQLATPEKLGLSSAVRSLSEYKTGGLCVCSGPAGSGKTTTLASLTQALTAQRALHVVTLENPIEVIHTAGLGLIEQRDVGTHVASFAAGIELAQRQGANLIVVSDLAAPLALEASLRAVRAGCLVLGSLRASSTAQALGKLLRAGDPLATERQRAELAYALRLLLHQRLIPRAKPPGRVAAFESVVNTAQVAQLIREDKLQQLPAVMAAGKSAGMTSLDEALDELVRAGTILPDAAKREAHRRERFKAP